MLSIAVHRDLTRYRAKVVGGLTARSLACTAAALLVGAATYGWLTWALGLPFEEVSLLIYASTLPLWALGFLEPQGMRPERWLPLWLRQHSKRARLAYGTRERYEAAYGDTEKTTTTVKGGTHGTSDTYRRFAQRTRAVERWEPGLSA